MLGGFHLVSALTGASVGSLVTIAGAAWTVYPRLGSIEYRVGQMEKLLQSITRIELRDTDRRHTGGAGPGHSRP